MKTVPATFYSLDRQQLAANDDRLRATAYHEAGHAVMALLLGRPIHKVTIAPARMPVGGVRLGACEIQKSRLKASNDWLEDEVLILLAGMVGESQLTGDYCRYGASQDLMAVRKLLCLDRASNQRQLERREQRMLDKAEHMLSEAGASKAIEWIARDLIEKTTISGRAVKHWINQAKQHQGK